MITVVLSHPNGNRQEVLLAGVPRIGESIQPANGADSRTLIVDHVLWMEPTQQELTPVVLIEVRPRDARGG